MRRTELNRRRVRQLLAEIADLVRETPPQIWRLREPDV
jgi:hypothetical protein